MNGDKNKAAPAPGEVSNAQGSEGAKVQQLKADLAKLRKMQINMHAAWALKNVLLEVLMVAKWPKVMNWEKTETSGSAVAFYDPRTGRPVNYEIRYQGGNLGNIVHELTHVVVNESYNQDFVNYPTSGKRPPLPEYDNLGRRKNEEGRQRQWMDQKLNDQMGGGLKDLSKTACRAGLPQDKLKQIKDKLLYGQQYPYIEYDTVLNQILTLMFEWGYPVKAAPGSAALPGSKWYKPSQESPFWVDLNAAVYLAYLRRLRARTAVRPPKDSRDPAEHVRVDQ
jgi:hypothetical protein